MPRQTHPTWESYLMSHSPRRDPISPRPRRVTWIHATATRLNIPVDELHHIIMEAWIAATEGTKAQRAKCGRWLNRPVGV